MATVAISYGHGENTYREKHSKGVTVGGVAYAEHTHNYQVGTRVRDILRNHGVTVNEVQPPNGGDVSLAERINKANDLKVDLYWSIHANAGVPAARGWAAFYWKGSAQGERIARLYAKYVKELGLPLYSNDGIHPSELGTWSEFAELRDTDMIACLTENGFMTNSADFEYVFKNKDTHYDKLAIAQARAILEYFGISYKGKTALVVNKEENDMQEVIVVINSINDYATAQPLAARLRTSTVERTVAEQVKLAKKAYIVGGDQGKVKADSFVVLSGADRYATAAAVKKFLG